MEHLWSDGTHVWLRSRELGDYYLHTDDDGVGVSAVHGRRARATLNTAWAVHVYHHEGIFLLLHSAAYGRYLAATPRPAPRAHRGRCVVQRNYDQPQMQAIMWQVIGAGSGAVILRNVGGRYLRANGKIRRWNRGVTVDEFDNISTMAHWIVEPIPVRYVMPLLQNPVREGLPGDLSVVLRLREAAAWQVIRFVLASNDGLYTEEEGWSEFRFRGRSVYHLRNELARRLALLDLNLIMCVRAGRYGRLTPLSENLPRDGHGATIEIVVIMRGTQAAYELRHPRVEAE